MLDQDLFDLFRKRLFELAKSATHVCFARWIDQQMDMFGHLDERDQLHGGFLNRLIKAAGKTASPIIIG